MSAAQVPDATTPRKPLRLWPGVVLVTIQWLLRFVVPVLVPETILYGMLGELACGVGIVVWWLFFSRAPWPDRLGALALMIAAVFAAPYTLHISIATGSMGYLFYVLVIPTLSLALVASLVATRGLADGPRRAAMAAAILLGSFGWALIRTGGFGGEFDHDFAWRWSPTPEERLLAEAKDEPAPIAAASPSPLPSAPASPPPPETRAKPAESRPSPKPTAASPAPPPREPEAEWPGFRGPGRNGIVRGVRVRTDWSAAPPVEMWGRRVGAGWASFAVGGGLVDLRRRGRPLLHAGAARGRRSRGLPPREHRRARVEASRPYAVLGVECGGGSARDAHPRQGPRLHVRGDGSPERARREERGR